MRRSDEIASAGVALFLLLLAGAMVAGGALVWAMSTDGQTEQP